MRTATKEHLHVEAIDGVVFLTSDNDRTRMMPEEARALVVFLGHAADYAARWAPT